MKKTLAFLICVNFAFMPLCFGITDDFALQTLDKNTRINATKKVVITDDFVLQTLDKNLKIKEKAYVPITDAFAEQNKNKNTVARKNVHIEEVLPSLSNRVPSYRKKVIIDTDNAQMVLVRIKKPFTTKSKPQEGSYIEFETIQDVNIGKKHFPAGSTVQARIETVSLNKAMGVPSELYIDNFRIGEIPLGGEISKVGANRTLWLYPAVCGGSIFFGAGLLLTPIRGGHAKIKTKEIFKLYAQ